MNREIKFRGKDLTYGVWRFGDLLQHNDGDVCIGVHDEHWTDDGLHLSFYLQESHVDEDTVGQYTGMKDKNGVEIYEGDIIMLGNFGTVFVWYNTKRCSFELRVYVSDGGFVDSLKDFNTDIYEVVGNIHDNPELLKGNHYE